jgi:hypothetical protein
MGEFFWKWTFGRPRRKRGIDQILKIYFEGSRVLGHELD